MHLSLPNRRLVRHLTGLALFLVAAASTTEAQDYVPALGLAFLPDEVATVRLTLAQTDLDFILNPDNAYSNVEWPGNTIPKSL